MKVGIVGCAHMHVESYIRCLKELGVPLTGVYDHHLEAGQDCAKRHDLPFVVSLEQLLAGCDTVVICSENKYHKEQAVAAANHGCHVIVEKPMALTVAEADEMITAAEANQVTLLVCHPVRFAPTMQELKVAVEEGQLGEIYAINASNHGKIPGGWFVEKELSGGGAIVDHTIHIADLVHWLFNLEIESVSANGVTAVSDIPTEDSGLLHVRFKTGEVLSLDTSWNRPEHYPVWGDAVLEIISEKGRTVVDGFGRKAELFQSGDNANQWVYYETDMDMAMFKVFKQVIEEDLPSPVDGKAGRFTIEMFQLAYEAINQQKRIEV
ncbi:Gfo/Idh/MocA family oxidoreductase [Vagococcus sp. BWB3-3]|uniref:Gfo/Idh/MocA family oxidoreductase n=1 Tax=Vagococcus allomyrinae TaxID=2794353 RepID=A0A940PGA2_9ENTE|nr:Gfo/Idh/MocA family oxidoreductase [Vagococcus allomyrinae]MBP1043011.1 Gfo/Idh/MocA family oxidoreductase [Vagococcus allomyrinae]